MFNNSGNVTIVDNLSGKLSLVVYAEPPADLNPIEQKLYAALGPDPHRPTVQLLGFRGAPGNNGTIKIDYAAPADSGHANRPHPGCAFQLRLFGFDDLVGAEEVALRDVLGEVAEEALDVEEHVLGDVVDEDVLVAELAEPGRDFAVFCRRVCRIGGWEALVCQSG